MVAWCHQAITWTIDLLFVGCCGIQQRVILKWVPQLLFCIMRENFTEISPQKCVTGCSPALLNGFVWFLKYHDDVIKWKHFSALLALYAGNSPVTGEFPTQMPVTRSFDLFFDLRLNKRLSKQSWGWWSETPSCSLWRQCNDEIISP